MFFDVTLMYVGWGELNSATVAADGRFELTQSFIVKDVPMNTNDL